MKFTTIKSEGGLIPFDILEKIYSGNKFVNSPLDFVKMVFSVVIYPIIEKLKRKGFV